jgi:hypothetical protein
MNIIFISNTKLLSKLLVFIVVIANFLEFRQVEDKNNNIKLLLFRSF